MTVAARSSRASRRLPWWYAKEGSFVDVDNSNMDPMGDVVNAYKVEIFEVDVGGERSGL